VRRAGARPMADGRAVASKQASSMSRHLQGDPMEQHP
jgi:hypothetical protein